MSGRTCGHTDICTDNTQTDRQVHIQRDNVVLCRQSSRCVRASAPSFTSEAAEPAYRQVGVQVDMEFLDFFSKMEACLIDIVSDNTVIEWPLVRSTREATWCVRLPGIKCSLYSIIVS